MLTHYSAGLFDYLSDKSFEMPIKPAAINTYLLFRLPAAYFCGVRVKTLNDTYCHTSVKHRWINQNPFKSMFWAVQGMAAELSTGALVMNYIKQSEHEFSMLLIANNSSFMKKARGRITFSCEDGKLIETTLKRAAESGVGERCIMQASGKDSNGDIVSEFNFEWSVRLKMN